MGTSRPQRGCIRMAVSSRVASFVSGRGRSAVRAQGLARPHSTASHGRGLWNEVTVQRKSLPLSFAVADVATLSWGQLMLRWIPCVRPFYTLLGHGKGSPAGLSISIPLSLIPFLPSYPHTLLFPLTSFSDPCFHPSLCTTQCQYGSPNQSMPRLPPF